MGRRKGLSRKRAAPPRRRRGPASGTWPPAWA